MIGTWGKDWQEEGRKDWNKRQEKARIAYEKRVQKGGEGIEPAEKKAKLGESMKGEPSDVCGI